MTKVEFQDHENEKIKSGTQEIRFSWWVFCWLLKFITEAEIDYYYDLLKRILWLHLVFGFALQHSFHEKLI